MLDFSEYVLIENKLLANVLSSLVSFDGKINVSEFRSVISHLRTFPLVVRLPFYYLTKYFSPQLIQIFNMIGDTKNDELDTVEFLSLNINLVLKPIFSDFRKNTPNWLY